MNLYKKCTAKPYYFLVTDAIFASNSPSSFRKNLLERIIDGKIKDEKLQYHINREAAKVSALSSGKIDKYEYLTGKETLPYYQRRVIGQNKFTYATLCKAFEKQIKTIEDQGEKQIKALEEHGKQLVKSNAFAVKKEKTYHVISKKKYYIILLQKELEKLKNQIMVIIFKILYIILSIPLTM